jgi:hypothetical protein
LDYFNRLAKRPHGCAIFLGDAPQCRALLPPLSMKLANCLVDRSVPFGAFLIDSSLIELLLICPQRV